MTDRQTEALKLALETLEVWKGYMPAFWDKTDEQAITAIREALAEQPAQQQEPVCDKDPRGCWSVRCQLGKVCKNTSTPASKPWVGLTDEEIKRMAAPWFLSMYWKLCVSFGRAIEAKLREKNA